MSVPSITSPPPSLLPFAFEWTCSVPLENCSGTWLISALPWYNGYCIFSLRWIHFPCTLWISTISNINIRLLTWTKTFSGYIALPHAMQSFHLLTQLRTQILGTEPCPDLLPSNLPYSQGVQEVPTVTKGDCTIAPPPCLGTTVLVDAGMLPW